VITVVYGLVAQALTPRVTLTRQCDSVSDTRLAWTLLCAPPPGPGPSDDLTCTCICHIELVSPSFVWALPCLGLAQRPPGGFGANETTLQNQS
jgi:hypothetical protein